MIDSRVDTTQEEEIEEYATMEGVAEYPGEVGSSAVFDYPAGTPVPVQVPTRKIVKGQVKELVVPKQIKAPDPIRAMHGQPRFDISQILSMNITLPLGQLLNESDQLRKEIAHGMQSSKPRYQVKRPTSTKQAVPANAVFQSEGPKAARPTGSRALPPHITARALDDDRQAGPLFITAWVEHNKFPQTLIDGGSLVELISARSMN